MDGFAPVNHGELYYEVEGSGHPLVLIHAGVADHTMWDAQVPAFAPRFRVIRYDCRGYGRSRSGDATFSNRQDLLDLLDHMHIPAAHVLGISRGGAIAIDFTLEHAERVTALIPVAAGFSGWEFPEGQEDPEEAAAFGMMEAAEEAEDWERLTDLEVRMWADGPGQPEGRASASVRERVRRWTLSSYTRIDGKTTALPLDPPAAGRLHEIHAPTLVMVGDLDTKSTRLMADVMVEQIPGARKELFPGVAHMVPLEAPDRFNELVLSFLP